MLPLPAKARPGRHLIAPALLGPGVIALASVLAACGAPAAAPDAPHAASATASGASSLTDAALADGLGAFAPTRVAGPLLAFSQILPPLAADGAVIGDVESQTGAALRLLDEALAAEGLGLGDVVQVTVHVVAEDGAIDTDGVARAWRRSFGNRLQPAAPARTIVGVSALPAPGARVSLSALALRPGPLTPDTTDLR